MRLRPEQWVLLAILGVALALLGLQVRHNITLPALRGSAPEPPASAGAAAPATPSAAGPQSAPAEAGSPTGAAASSAPAEAGSAAGAAASAAPAEAGSAPPAAPPAALSPPPDPPPPGPNSPSLGLQVEPETTSPRQPILVHLSLDGAPEATEVFFELRFDARLVAPDAGAFEAQWPAGDQPAQMQVDVPEPGRLLALVRRPAAPAGPPAGRELCVLQFTTQERGAAALRLTRGGARDARGEWIGARGAEAKVEVR